MTTFINDSKTFEIDFHSSPIEVHLPRTLAHHDFIMLNFLRYHLIEQIINNHIKEKDSYSDPSTTFEERLSHLKSIQQIIIQMIDSAKEKSSTNYDSKEVLPFVFLSPDIERCLFSHDFINLFIRKVLIQIACSPTIRHDQNISSSKAHQNSPLLYDIIKYQPCYFIVKINKTSVIYNDLIDNFPRGSFQSDENESPMSQQSLFAQMNDEINSLIYSTMGTEIDSPILSKKKTLNKKSKKLTFDPFHLSFILSHFINKYNLYEDLNQPENEVKSIAMALPEKLSKYRKEIIERLDKMTSEVSENEKTIHIPVLFYPFINIHTQDLATLFSDDVISNPNQFHDLWIKFREKVTSKPQRKSSNDQKRTMEVEIDEFFTNFKRVTRPPVDRLHPDTTTHELLKFHSHAFHQFHQISKLTEKEQNTTNLLSHCRCPIVDHKMKNICSLCQKEFDLREQSPFFQFRDCGLNWSAFMMLNTTRKWKNASDVPNSWDTIVARTARPIDIEIIDQEKASLAYLESQLSRPSVIKGNFLSQSWFDLYNDKEKLSFHDRKKFQYQKVNRIVRLNEVLHGNTRVQKETDYYTSLIREDLSLDQELLQDIHSQYFLDHLVQFMPPVAKIDFGAKLKFMPGKFFHSFQNRHQDNSKKDFMAQIFIIPDIGRMIPFHKCHLNNAANEMAFMKKRSLSYQTLMKVMMDLMHYIAFYLFREDTPDENYDPSIIPNLDPNSHDDSMQCDISWDDLCQRFMELNARHFAIEIKNNLKNPKNKKHLYHFWQKLNEQFIFDHMNFIKRFDQAQDVTSSQTSAQEEKPYLSSYVFHSLFYDLLHTLEKKYLREQGIIST
tara:strand:- start:1149 stop:3662 length:2514 start_codon:yes stop_codon:yes gene_type:complete